MISSAHTTTNKTMERAKRRVKGRQSERRGREEEREEGREQERREVKRHPHRDGTVDRPDHAAHVRWVVVHQQTPPPGHSCARTGGRIDRASQTHRGTLMRIQTD